MSVHLVRGSDPILRDQAVAVEEEDVAAAIEHGLDDPGEDVVDDLRDRLAPDAAAAGQAFREPGEPRDVREEQRTVEIEVPSIARQCPPVDRKSTRLNSSHRT